MKRKRIGNDLHIAWSLLMKDGNIFLLEGKELSVYLKTPFGKVELSDYIIKDNKVEWTFFGKDQKVIGQYSLILVVNYGKEGMVSTDVCNFVELVAHSCQEGGSSPSGVQVESIELTSIVEYGGGAEVDLTDYLTKEEAGRTYLPREEFNDRIEENEDLIENLSADKEDKSNKTTTLSSASTDTQYPSAKAVYDALQNVGGGGGASTDKQGVVSQTLIYNSTDNTYSVSNVVRGSIPSFFIDLVTEAGASFNAESGYFSLNGIDNIAYDEMRQIYNCRTGYGVNSLLAVYGSAYTARTNFAAFRGFEVSYPNHQPTTFYAKYLCARNTSITKFVIHNESIPLYVRADSVNNFEALGTGADPILRSRLEEIIGIIDVANLTGSANFFYNGTYQPWLTSFQLKSLKASIDLSGMPRLSEATILYMINNEKAASAITIKLHADAKAMADASEAIQSALSNHANITLGV